MQVEDTANTLKTTREMENLVMGFEGDCGAECDK
jgi:hypothetical protein